MNATIQALRDACETHSINSISIVDDIFDVPRVRQLDRDAYEDFLEDWDSDPTLAQTARRIAKYEVSELPAYDDLEDESNEIKAIWRTLCEGTVKQGRVSQASLAKYRAAFHSHGDDVLSMLDRVSAIVRFFKNDIGCSYHYCGAELTQIEKLAKSDIVVVDYFLQPDLAESEALDLVSEVVKEICRAAEEIKGTRPSFVVMSSEPNRALPSQLREEANLMAARFRFIPKDDLVKATPMRLADIHNIVEAYQKTEKVETLVNDWRKAAETAVEEVQKQFLRFDIADYIYLDAFRLYNEGVSISSYLRWLLGAHLDAHIPRKLDQNRWKSAEKIRLFDADISTERDPGVGPDDSNIIGAFEGLTETVAHAYGDIIFDETRGSGRAAFPNRPKPADLIEGDIFVQGKSSSANLDGRSVRLIMTPTCDLIVRGGSLGPNAKNVLLLHGTLKRLKFEQKNRLSDISYIQVRTGRGGKTTPVLYEVVWDFNSPVSVSWDTISNTGINGYVRLGRIREPQFYAIRTQFVQRLNRIGQEVSPPYPSPQAVEVHVRVGSDRNRLLSASVEDGLAWQYSRSNTQFVHVSRSMIDRIVAALRSPKFDDATREPITDTLNSLENMLTLTRPAKFGNRVSQNFCRIVDHGNPSQVTKSINSNASLVILVGDPVPEEA